MTIDGGLGESYDIDELWPDEAEIGSMLRTHYRRQPPPSVMARHLLELENEMGAVGRVGPGPRIAARVLAAACLLVAAVAVGLLINGADASRIDTVGDGRVESTTTMLTATTAAAPSTQLPPSTVPPASTAPPASNPPTTAVPPSTAATPSTTVGPPSTAAQAPTEVEPTAGQAPAPSVAEPTTTSAETTTSADSTTTTQASTTSPPTTTAPTTAPAPAPTEPPTTTSPPTTTPPTTAPTTTAPEECQETGGWLFRSNRCDDGRPGGLFTGLLDLLF